MAKEKNAVQVPEKIDYVCEPLPGETPKAFAAFTCYLGLGEARSVRGVARKLHKSDTVIGLWSRKYGWQRRLLAWNQKILDGQRAEAEIIAREGVADWSKRQRELRNREWEIANKALTLCSRLVEKLLAQKRRKATVHDLSRLLEAASKIGRLSAGLATDRGELTGPDGGAIQVDLTLALKKVYGDAGLLDGGPGDSDAVAVAKRANAGVSFLECPTGRDIPVIEAEVV